MFVVLPINNAINEFHQMACRIDMFDYDLDEVIRLTLDALLYPDWYPNSYDQFVRLDPQHCAYTPDQYAAFNELLWFFYNRIYQALTAAGLYQSGALQLTYFCIYRGDLIVSDVEIPDRVALVPGVC